jgi:Tfp pilus assembly protein PilN
MLAKYYRINQVVGVDMTIQKDGELLIHACSISANGNQMEIAQKVSDLNTVDVLKKHFPAKTLIALNLNGKGILYRQIDKTDDIHAGNFNKILPSADFDDFYIQHIVSGELSFVTVIRKTEADRWIQQFNNSGFVPLSLSLGPFTVQNIIPQLNTYDNELIFNGHQLQRDDQLHWINYSYDETFSSRFVIKIETTIISEKLLLPYSVAFQLVLAEHLDEIKAEVPSLDTALQNKLANNKLKVKGFIFLTALFVLLLINFLVFSSLDTANARLTEQVSRSAQSTTDVEQLKQQAGQKEALLNTLGWEGNIDKSVLIDQLASLLPGEIIWKEVALNPVDLAASNIQKTIVFYSRKIRIVGTSEKIIPVNEWMARIRTRKWVKNVQLDNYTFNSELNTGQFSIIIDY